MSLNNSIADGTNIPFNETTLIGEWGIVPWSRLSSNITYASKQSEDNIAHINLPAKDDANYITATDIVIGNNTTIVGGDNNNRWGPPLPSKSWENGDKIILVFNPGTGDFGNISLHGRPTNESTTLQSLRIMGEDRTEHDLDLPVGPGGSRYLKLQRCNGYYTIKLELVNASLNRWLFTVTNTDPNIEDWDYSFTDTIKHFVGIGFWSKDNQYKIRQVVVKSEEIDYSLAPFVDDTQNVKCACKLFGPRFRNLIY